MSKLASTSRIKTGSRPQETKTNNKKSSSGSFQPLRGGSVAWLFAGSLVTSKKMGEIDLPRKWSQICEETHECFRFSIGSCLYMSSKKWIKCFHLRHHWNQILSWTARRWESPTKILHGVPNSCMILAIIISLTWLSLFGSIPHQR